MDLFAPLAGIAAVVVPVFIVAALGFGWNRAKLPYDSAFITTFSLNISTPCLVFSSLSALKLGGDQMLTMTIASIGSMGISALGGFIVLTILRQPLRVYLPALSFPNSGNLGLPVCLFAFGETGLGIAVLFFAVMAVSQFTIGPAMAAGRVELAMIVRSPVIYAVVAALALRFLDVQPPLWLTNTTSLIGNCSVPLMLFSLGIALSTLRIRNALKAAALSVLRIVLGISAGLIMASLLGMTGTMRGVIILQSAMPVAVFNYLWALRYGTGSEEVAAMVLCSTVLIFLGLPFLLLLVL